MPSAITIPVEARFILYVVGLYASFIYWGYLQEKLTSSTYTVDTGNGVESLEWNFPFALNFFMALGGFLAAALIELVVPNPTVSKSTFNEFWKAAATCALASPVGYASLKYITFPMMVLTKSSKPVPVMLIGIVFYGKKYPWYKYVSVLLVCGGIALFSSAKKGSDSSGPASQSLAFGIFLVLVNLMLDGYTNNEQDRIFEQFKTTSLEMMKFTNLWQMIFLLSYLVIFAIFQGGNSELFSAWRMFTGSPQVAFDIGVFCTCASVGQVLIFSVMKEFGSLTWITISITRKLFTILVSIFAFNHSVKPLQWAGVASVFVGLTLETIMGYLGKPLKSAELKKKE